jgi:hypothetical protein
MRPISTEGFERPDSADRQAGSGTDDGGRRDDPVPQVLRRGHADHSAPVRDSDGKQSIRCAKGCDVLIVTRNGARAVSASWRHSIPSISCPSRRIRLSTPQRRKLALSRSCRRASNRSCVAFDPKSASGTFVTRIGMSTNLATKYHR